jgi:exodeoxyribonuclease VII small subunit
MTDKGEKTFEDMMAELEGIVVRLEGGELPLETALAAFENGVQLVRQLNERLNAAETRIEALTRDADGSLRLHPLRLEEDSKDG